jgi:hypothetical protein
MSDEFLTDLVVPNVCNDVVGNAGVSECVVNSVAQASATVILLSNVAMGFGKLWNYSLLKIKLKKNVPMKWMIKKKGIKKCF